MLKSKLRKTGVYLHLRTRSLENACYSSTTCPTLSTLFLQNVPDCPPEALSFLPRFARFYSIYYIQAVPKTHFLQVKIFIPPTEKHRGLPVGRRARRSQIPAQLGRSAAIFRAFSVRCKQRFHARICPLFPGVSDACFRMFFALLSSLLYIKQVSRRTDVFANADASCGGKGRTGVSAQFKTLHGREAQARRRQSENLRADRRYKSAGSACLVELWLLTTRCSGCRMFHVKHIGRATQVYARKSFT